MPTNNQKTPLVDSLNRFVSDKITDVGQLAGKSLPASIMAIDPSNTIVTVKFEIKTQLQIPIVQCPVGFPEYIRLPLQVGDKGFVVAVDAYMGGMSQIGKGIASLDQQPNLSTLVWFPCGSKAFTPTEEPTKIVTYGSTGAVIRDKDKIIVLTLDKDRGLQVIWNGVPLMTFSNNGISIQYQGKGIVINSGGTFIDGVNFLPHTHSGVQSGPNPTGPVVP